MSKIAIKAENLSKAYQLGQIGTGTISRDLERWYARIRGKEDPFLRIGESNNQHTKSDSDVVWSLKDINFEIEQGDAVGIIGRNGAGKSTLLKILSKVTAPTTGKITGKGRIASLLEVGTGFHPELSGRENIFLNGAILGMRKKEIQCKLEEIVDFAGIERYLDTPVKRYSSGMYVRLAFAVAAHLESEILIVDEVLAVGDAEFQKKCLGKMDEVSKSEGRTVLFVSHNMGSVQSLCKKGLLLNNGRSGELINIESAISKYRELGENQNENYKTFGPKSVEAKKLSLKDHLDTETNEFSLGKSVALEIELLFHNTFERIEIGINIKNTYDEIITHITNLDKQLFIHGKSSNKKNISISIPSLNLTPGTYFLDLFILNDGQLLDSHICWKKFSIINSDQARRPGGFPQHIKIYTETLWKV